MLSPEPRAIYGEMADFVQGQIRTVTAHTAKGKLLAQYIAGRLR